MVLNLSGITPLPQRLFQSSAVGLAVRIFVVCFGLGLVLVLLIGLRYAECLPLQLTEKQLWLAFMVVVFSTAWAQIFSEYPAGEDKAFFRLAAATAVRTGFPATVILVGAALNDSLVTAGMISILMLFYCIGLFASLYLEIGRLNRQIQSRGNA